MLKRKLWKKDSGFKNSITSGEFGNSFNLLRHRSWDSMTHETCTLILQCLVSCSCQKSSVKRAIQGHSGQISSKTINGPQFFFVVATKNPFMEDLLGSSLRTIAHPKLLKILPRSANFFQRSAAPVGAPESAEWFTFRRNFFYFGQGWGTSHYDRESNSMANHQIGF